MPSYPTHRSDSTIKNHKTAEKQQQGDEDNQLACVTKQRDVLLKACQCINGWSKCQCKVTHGDNPNCCVLVAEQAIAKAAGHYVPPITEPTEDEQTEFDAQDILDDNLDDLAEQEMGRKS